MNKERLILLIALSITVVLVIVSIFIFQPKDIEGETLVSSTTPQTEIKEVIPPAAAGSEENVSETIVSSEPEPIVELIPDKYPEARAIWNYLKDYGFSDYVAAGIIGNMVAEVGDPSTKEPVFDLDWKNNSGYEIGLCQWTSGRKATIMKLYGKVPDIGDQIQFIYDEMLGNNGVTRQITEKQYQEIIKANSPSRAAYLFALYFERCAKGSYKTRQFKAEQAYEYFTK